MKAEYIKNTQDDLMVVNAARVSFDVHSSVLTQKDVKLINYLAKHDHWTPFSHCRETFSVRLNTNLLSPTETAGMIRERNTVRHSLYGWSNILKKGVLSPTSARYVREALSFRYKNAAKALGIYTHPSADYSKRIKTSDKDFIDITLRETVPIFVARQRFKHMVGFTYNEVSRRYVDSTPEFFIPTEWRARPDKSIKQGSGQGGQHEHWHQPYQKEMNKLVRMYEIMVADGVAPEQARMILPQSMYTSYYVTGSLAAWARAYKQRIDPHAQVEIQELAKQWGKIINPLFPVAWEALTE